MIRKTAPFALALLCVPLCWLLSAPAAPADEYAKTVAPFLRQHCAKCHSADVRKGKLTLHDLPADVGKDADRWRLVAERVALGEMPPEDAPRPDARDAERFVAWVKAALAAAGKSDDVGRKLLLPGHGNRVDHDALFSGKVTEPAASPPRLWRMSPQAYASFIPRVAAGQKAGGKKSKGVAVAQPFSLSSAEGFKDYADLFALDEPTLEQLIRNANRLVEMQTTKGVAGRPVKEFLALTEEGRTPGDAEARAAVRKQFQVALLRDPTPAEADKFAAFYKKNVADAGQVLGARTTLAAVLLLPEATYRAEVGRGQADGHGRRMLSPRELAFAVSFALTDDGPDAALLAAAEGGRLKTREDVAREVKRLLDDAKCEKPRILRFFEEYFEYPAAEDVFKDLMRGQWRPEVIVNDTRQLILWVLRRDKDVLKELLTTDRSFVNYKIDNKGVASPARVANKKGDKGKRQLEYHDLYDLPEDWKWTAEQPIALPKGQRAGVLTQPSWLAAFATNDETHAIRRGKWVRERLLGGVVPDLPITVDAQLPHAPEKTIRQRMEVTTQEYCWQCHQKMNPLGLAFESYDYLGRFRKTETVADLRAPKQPAKGKEPARLATKEVPLDATGVVTGSGESKLDGKVDGAVEMIRRLADGERVRHAFRYWMGRNEALGDAPTLLRADRDYVASGGSMKALIVSLLTSDSFLYRRGAKK